VPLNFLKISSGVIGLFANTQWKNRGQEVAVVGTIDGRIEINSIPNENSLVIEDNGTDKSLLVSGLKPINGKLPRCHFAEVGKQIASLSENDFLPGIRLPCIVFAENVFMGFDRRGGAVAEGWHYTWGGSFYVKKIVACIEYVQRSPRVLTQLDFDTAQHNLEGCLVANFMGLAEK
jgi:hypothetical protein